MRKANRLVLGYILVSIAFAAVSCGKKDAVPTSVALTGIDSLTAGGQTTCAAVGGAVKCWGSGLNAGIGDGTSGGDSHPALPTQTTGLTTGATAVAIGPTTSCALINTGQAQCWGGVGAGAASFVGIDATVSSSTVPGVVKGMSSGVTAIAVGSRFACAVLSTAVYCWGTANAAGGLGDGTTNASAIPVLVISGGAKQVAVGGNHACALLATGGVKCWGNNTFGQLGDGTTTQRDTPVDVSGLTSGVAAISAGGRDTGSTTGGDGAHTCAVLTSGALKCWGYNAKGQLGNGTTTNAVNPADVTGLTSGVTAVAAGYKHTCAVVADGGVKCWGLNDSGQLGNGTTTDSLTPVSVTGIASGAAAVTAAGSGAYVKDQSGSHSCALLTDKTAKCWGYAAAGQLGDGTTGADAGTKTSSTPVQVLLSN
jgi:alpha-tubulin suppressor-like RCC1 family protein